MRNGDPAPSPQTGSYLAFGGTTGQGGGSIATPAILDTGVNGLFGLSGAGEVIVAEGDPAPVTPAGAFDAGLAQIGPFGVNASADVAFVSGIDGGTRHGLFMRNAAGMTEVAGDGDLVGAGPETFASFAHPALNDSRHVVFAGEIAGGAASSGLFLHTGSGASPLAYAGDVAPGTGGGTFSSFLYPAIATDDRVAFLSEVVGGSASAGLFVASPAVASVLVEGQSVPGAGPVVVLSSLPAIADDGSLAMSLGFASGPVAGGVYVYTGGVFTPAALAGEVAPDSGRALRELRDARSERLGPDRLRRHPRRCAHGRLRRRAACTRRTGTPGGRRADRGAPAHGRSGGDASRCSARSARRWLTGKSPATQWRRVTAFRATGPPERRSRWGSRRSRTGRGARRFASWRAGGRVRSRTRRRWGASRRAA